MQRFFNFNGRGADRSGERWAPIGPISPCVLVQRQAASFDLDQSWPVPQLRRWRCRRFDQTETICKQEPSDPGAGTLSGGFSPCRSGDGARGSEARATGGDNDGELGRSDVAGDLDLVLHAPDVGNDGRNRASHGRRGLSKLLIGSVTNKVLT